MLNDMEKIPTSELDLFPLILKLRGKSSVKITKDFLLTKLL